MVHNTLEYIEEVSYLSKLKKLMYSLLRKLSVQPKCYNCGYCVGPQDGEIFCPCQLARMEDS